MSEIGDFGRGHLPSGAEALLLLLALAARLKPCPCYKAPDVECFSDDQSRDFAWAELWGLSIWAGGCRHSWWTTGNARG